MKGITQVGNLVSLCVQIRARGSLVVKALDYNPEGHGFEMR
jgi:hypothetical protein